MFKSYIKVAFRNLLKQEVFSSINIFGLSLGIACCTLATLLVQNEVTYDRHYNNVDSLFRVESHFKTMDFSSTPTTFAA